MANRRKITFAIPFAVLGRTVVAGFAGVAVDPALLLKYN
jgi:hypothetical protein